MCIIIAKNKGKKLDKDIYEESFRFNKDGGGIAYVKDKKLVIDKGFFAFGPFYEEIQKYEKQDMIIHCRISNRGMINQENCHPFLVECPEFPGISFAIAHNGTLDWRSTPTKSDTLCFVEDVIGHQLSRDPWFLDNLPGVVLLEKFLGYSNKMVIMRYMEDEDETKMYILNEKAGNTSEGCWFSNYTWKKWEPVEHDFGYGGVYNYARGMAHGMAAAWKGKTGEPATVIGGKLTAYAEYLIRKSETTKKKVREDIDKLMGKNFDDAKKRYDEICKEGTTQTKVLTLTTATEQPTQAEVDALIDGQTELGKITVPRDADIDNWEYCPTDLKHLSKKERKYLVRLANDILKECQVNSRDMTQTDKVTWLRFQAMERFPSMTNCKPEDIDKTLAEGIYDAMDFKLVSMPEFNS